MKQLITGLKSFVSPTAWLLIVVGSMLMSSRIPVSGQLFVNLPELVTALQLAGGILVLCGFGIITSQVFWPQVQMDPLMAEVMKGNVAAAIVVFGLKTFCGLTIIGFAIWLALTMTGLTGGHNG